MTDLLPPVSARDLDEILRTTSSDVWAALRGQALFITGGTGFVGKWLLESLVHADRQLGLGLSATVLTRDPAAFRAASPHLANANIVRLVQGDVADFDFPSGDFAYVLHAALPVAPPQSSAATLQSMATAGARRACEFAEVAGARRMLHVSSGAVYGPRLDGEALSEDASWTAGETVNLYTQAKRAAEAVVLSSEGPFEVVIARCFAFTGPYLMPSSGSAAAQFVAAAGEGRGIVVDGTGETVRSYQYAGDMARWLLTCLVKGRAGRAYNVGSDVPVTIGQLAQHVARLAGAVAPVRFAGRATAGLAGNRYVADVRRAKTELGLVNVVDLEDGILRTLGWQAGERPLRRTEQHSTGSPMKPQFEPSSLRRTVVEMAYAGSAVHLGCAFSIIELLSALYGRHMRYDLADPNDPMRDYLVLSKGHGVMAQYACLYELGWLDRKDIDSYFHDGSRLKGLSDAHVPGCEVTSGSLGHGLSVGVGLALAASRRKTGQKCYVVVGDGEMNEGPIWEGLLFAAHAKLDNLMVIVDANGFQAMGTTDEVMSLGDLGAKFSAFDFDVRSVDGHDPAAISEAVEALMSLRNGRPKALVAKTVKGKGVSYMENVNAWHYSRLNPDLHAQALQELQRSPA